MDKEEILRRSREENNDEMEVQRRERGMAKVNRWTIVLFYIVIAVLTYYGFISRWIYFAFLLVACIPALVWYFYSYWKTRDSGELASLIVLAISILVSGHLVWTML